MKSRARGFESHPLRGLAALGPILAAAAFSGAVEAERAPPSTISVATWNIAWFGDGVRDEVLTGNRRDGRHLRDADDLTRLRGIVRRLADRGVEVVGLQEIENAAAARRLFPERDWDLFVSRRAPAPEWSQRTGIAVRRSAGWRVERHPDIVEWSPQGRDRHGVDLTLSRGEERVRVLTVHFQSGCNREPLASAKPRCGFLRMQFAVLKGWLYERREEATPVVVAGDWNRLLSRPGDEALALLPGSPLLLPPPGSAPGCWSGRFDNFVDHILAFAPPGGRAVRRSFEELLYDAPVRLRDRLSDHCPLIATVAFGQ